MTDINEPLVSIIIPTYNRAFFLQRAIDSALIQTYKNIEVIVVDDASSDNTREIIEKLNDSRIRYIKHDANQGGSAARNTGIKASIGKYISFLDDDDEFHPDKTREQVLKFKSLSDDFGAIYCWWDCKYENRICERHKPRYTGDVLNRFLLGGMAWTSTVLLRKECFKEAGFFDTSLASCQEWDIFIRISAEYKFDFVPKFLVSINYHGSNISTNLTNKISSRSKVLEKNQTLLAKHPFAHSAQQGRLGILLALNGEKKYAYSRIFTAMKICPIFWKNYAYLFLMFLDKFLPGIVEKFVVEKNGNLKIYR